MRAGGFGVAVLAVLAALAAKMPLAGQEAGGVGAEDQAATIARAVEELREGSPLALAVLQRTPEASAEALLQEVAADYLRRRERRATTLLPAISALGVATPEVIGGLLDLLEPAGDLLRSHILRAIGDLAVHAGECPRLDRWLAQLPTNDREQLVALFVSIKGPRRMGAFTACGRVQARRELCAKSTDLGTCLNMLEELDLDSAELAAERVRALGRSSPQIQRALESLVLYETPADGVTDWVAVGHHHPQRLIDLESACTVQLAAASTLVQLHPESAQLRTAHRLILEQGRPDQQLASLMALRADVDQAPLDVGAIVALLGRANHRVLRREAVITLSTLGPRASAAVPALRELADGEDQELSVLALAALRAIEQR